MTLRELLTQNGLSPEDILDIEVGHRSAKGIVINGRFQYDEFPTMEIELFAPIRVPREAGKR